MLPQIYVSDLNKKSKCGSVIYLSLIIQQLLFCWVFWSTHQLQISWIFKLIAFFKAVFFLNYISVTSSIFVNKFLQKCQNYYTLSSPKHPSGNCYVSCFLTDIAALTLLDPHFETRLTLRSFYPQTQSSADLLIIFDTFSKRTLIPLLI